MYVFIVVVVLLQLSVRLSAGTLFVQCNKRLCVCMCLFSYALVNWCPRTSNQIFKWSYTCRWICMYVCIVVLQKCMSECLCLKWEYRYRNQNSWVLNLLAFQRQRMLNCAEPQWTELSLVRALVQVQRVYSKMQGKSANTLIVRLVRRRSAILHARTNYPVGAVAVEPEWDHFDLI